MVLPLIFVVVSLLFFFGLNMARLQRTSVVDRYAAVREVTRAPGPTSTSDLNEHFFRDEADDLQIDTVRAFPETTGTLLADAAYARTDDAGEYAEALLSDLPHGRRAEVAARHDTNVPLWSEFADTIERRHTVLNGPWPYVNGVIDNNEWFDEARNRWVSARGASRLYHSGTVRDQFYETFDEALEPFASTGNEVASDIRDWYLRQPVYRGPQVGDETPWP